MCRFPSGVRLEEYKSLFIEHFPYLLELWRQVQHEHSRHEGEGATCRTCHMRVVGIRYEVRFPP